MAEIADLLSDPACRLLTLVGPGGIGKTRLAIEAATPMLDDFAHSVYFVALQPISETANIVSAIASAIDCQFYEAAEPEQQLLNFLREKQMLLLLDNFEHLLAGTSLVVSILETAPEVKVLVTSREVLRLQQEWVYDIRGMSFPEDVKTTPLETYSAVHLFVERARRAQGHFKLEDNWADVVRICQLIEGMPLGIELAAAWTRIMSCQQLAEELAVSLDILTSRQRGLEPRHASLRAVFAHSWKLLNEDEQLVLMKLSVFKGGFTAEAAAAIAGASLPLLAALVDKSLLRADEEGRYDLHEAVRQFAAELLAADTDAELETRERHCDYFAQLLHERVVAVQLISWTEVLPEMDNVRVAWTHAAQQRKLSALQQAMPALSGIYLLQAWFEEGERMFQFAEDGLRDLPPTDDTRFLLGAALLFKAHCQRDQLAKADQMKRNLEAGLALWQGMAPRREMILPHWHAIYVLFHLRSAPEQIIEAANHHLVLARRFDDQGGEAQAIECLAHIYWQGLGDFAQAQQYVGEASAIRRQDISHRGLQFLGEMAYAQGQFTEAKVYLAEFLGQLKKAGTRHSLHSAYFMLGRMALDSGDDETAKTCFETCVAAASDLPIAKLLVAGLAGLGAVAVFQHDIGTAERYYADSRARFLAFSRKVLRYRDELVIESLSLLALLLGRYDEAAGDCEKLLAHFQSAGYRLQLPALSCRMGHALLGLGNEQRAMTHLLDAVHHAAEMGAFPMLLEALVGLAQLPTVPPEEAVVWLTLAKHQSTANRYTRSRAEQLLLIHQAALPQAAFTDAAERGQRYSLEEAVARAGRLFSRPDPAQCRAVQCLVEPLSEREIEVLHLIAEGLSNREVGERLHITLSTVKVHAHNIYGKLAVRNRTEAVARARALGVLPS